MRQFFVELRRRRVLQTGAAYIVGAWVVLQVADLALGSMGLPEQTLRHVWLAMIVGFPVALIFGWRYDITGEGIVRTPPTAAGEAPDLSLNGVDYTILAALVAVTVAILWSALRDIGDAVVASNPAADVAPGGPNTIAVLPLENLSGSEEQDFLAAGMHDALITSLSRITAFRVISRTSTLRVDSGLSLPEVAATLGVARVVEGSVTREGDRVRIIVQLIDAATDSHVWAESFERNFSGLLTLQNEMARAIARAIEVQLTPVEEERLSASAEVDPETYESYLRGMYLLHKDTRAGFRRGMEILHAAVERDPGSALAYAGLAYGYGKIGHSFFPDRRSNPRLKYTATRALALDDGLAEAHLAVGMYQLYSEWDFPAAEWSLRRAVELNPSLVAAHYHLAWLLELLGRDDEAIEAAELTEQLDPLSPFYSGWLAEQYRDAGRFEQAIETARATIDLSPHFPVGWFVLGRTYLDMGRYDEAIEALERLEGMPFWSWSRVAAYAAVARLDEAEAIAEALGDDPDNAIPLVLVNGILGNDAEMLRWMEVARDGNFPWYPWLAVWFDELKPFHDTPEFRQFAAELELDLLPR